MEPDDFYNIPIEVPVNTEQNIMVMTSKLI